jgi:hypothetical protein
MQGSKMSKNAMKEATFGEDFVAMGKDLLMKLTILLVIRIHLDKMRAIQCSKRS